MKNRNGYVFEENGKWFARVTFTDERGKRRNVKRTAKTKTEAKELLKQLTRQIEDEGTKAIDIAKLTFNDLADYYEQHYLKPAEYSEERKIAGLRSYKHQKPYIPVFRDYFGNRKLREITYGDLLSYRSERLKTHTKRKKRRTISTVNRELSYLRRILNIALREGWILKNPFNCGDSLLQISAEKKRDRILTLDEEQRLLNACDHLKRKHLKPLFIALLDTGARKGEMLKLKWSDVDFDSRLIMIQALNTKTLKSRQVAITQRLFDELQDLWEKSGKNPESFVFGISDNVRKSFSSACKAAGIKEGGLDGLTLHCLRHTAATRLVKGQLPIQMVGRILGHTQPQTTYRYLSANQETLHQAASIFDSLQTPKFEDVPEISGFVN